MNVYKIYVVIILCVGLSLKTVNAASTKTVIDGFIISNVQTNKQQIATADDIDKQTTVDLDFNVVVDALVNGDFIDLQLFNKGYLITIDQTQAESPGVMTYLGSVYTRNREKVSGNVLLTLGNGMVHGLITTADGIYQLVPSEGDQSETYNLQKMRQIAAEGMTDFPDPAIEKNQSDLFESIALSNINPPAVMSSGCCTVGLLVLFTPYTRWNKGGTTATINWINTIVASYNQKLAEVGLNSYSLSLKAAKETSWPTFSTPYHENNTHNGATACFTVSGQSFCDSLIADQFWVSTNTTVANLRNQYAADLVVLITANSRKHPSDFAHGFAGLKNDGVFPQTHGTIGTNNDCYIVAGENGGRDCGEFVSVRDSFALSNLTFHHEVGHALGLRHPDGVLSFGFYSNGVEQQSFSNHIKPFTIMEALPPICLWSAPITNSS
jgi:hypothetical protein